MNIPAIGASIPAADVRPGYVLELPNGDMPIAVERIERDGQDVRVSQYPPEYHPRWIQLDAGAPVKVLGYFNPETEV